MREEKRRDTEYKDKTIEMLAGDVADLVKRVGELEGEGTGGE